MKRLLLLPLVLAACVSSGIPDEDRADGLVEGEPAEGVGTAPVWNMITVDGRTLELREEKDWPSMAAVVNPATGKTEVVQTGTAETIIIRGARGDFALAVKVLAQYCGRPIDPKGFDTQFVFRDAAKDEYWFDGFCG